MVWARYPKYLLFSYLVVWLLLAISPTSRADWLLENLLVVVVVPLLIWTYYKFRLSNVSYTLFFLFMVLHAFGSHWTYAQVPFGFWMQDFFGLTRNHFDRIVHFSYGLLLSYPIREVFLRVAQTKGVWGYWFPIELTLAFSALYEIIEMAAVMVVSPEAGSAFLGMQGDQWDAQKDMALAGLGSVIAMSVTALVNWRYNRKFGRELKQSVKVKEKSPLGEVSLAKMRKGK